MSIKLVCLLLGGRLKRIDVYLLEAFWRSGQQRSGQQNDVDQYDVDRSVNEKSPKYESVF